MQRTISGCSRIIRMIIIIIIKFYSMSVIGPVSTSLPQWDHQPSVSQMSPFSVSMSSSLDEIHSQGSTLKGDHDSHSGVELILIHFYDIMLCGSCEVWCMYISADINYK